MSETAMDVEAQQIGTETEPEPEADRQQPENGFVSPEGTAAAAAAPGLLASVDGCVLKALGGFGRYQKQLIVLTWIPALFIGFWQCSDHFLLSEPNITCIAPAANATHWTQSHSALVHGAKNGSRHLSALLNETIHPQCLECSEWTFELHTGLMENVATKWSLVCDSLWKVHISKFSFLLGSIFGFLALGVLADWFGRKPVLILSALFMLVFGLAVAFSVTLPMFSVLRFFEGFCLAGIILAIFVLRVELCLPKWRFSMTMVASFVVLGGQLMMPGLAYLCRDWQVLQAVIICPLLLMLSYIWMFPESLRWLLATQQYSISKWIMGHIAKKNQVNSSHATERILQELHGELHKKPKKTCIVVKMKGTRNLWKNITVLCLNSLTGQGVHTCFIRGIMDPEADRATMFHNFYYDYYATAGIAVVSCLALSLAVGLMGRRGGLLMFMIITALASLLQLGLLNLLGKYSVQLNIVRSDTLNRNFDITFSVIGMFSSQAVSNLCIFYCAEITPTAIRGGGVGMVLASGGLGMLTPPIMELTNQKAYFLQHIIFSCLSLICIICILLLPEPRNQPLPETMADGDMHPLVTRKPRDDVCRLLGEQEGGGGYAQVHGSPCHEHADAPAAAAAASNMGSTSSSAVDLTAPSVINLTAVEPHPKDPNGRSYWSLPMTPVGPSSLAGKERAVGVLSGKEHLLSSTPLHRAPCATDPLLSDAEETKEGIELADIKVISRPNGKGVPAPAPAPAPPPRPESPAEEPRAPPSPRSGGCSPTPAVQPLLGSPLGPPLAVDPGPGPPAVLETSQSLGAEAGPAPQSPHDRRPTPPPPPSPPPPPPVSPPPPPPPPSSPPLCLGPPLDVVRAPGPPAVLETSQSLGAEAGPAPPSPQDRHPTPPLPPSPSPPPPASPPPLPPTDSSSPLTTRDSPPPPPPIDTDPPPQSDSAGPPPTSPSPPPSRVEETNDGTPPPSPPPPGLARTPPSPGPSPSPVDAGAASLTDDPTQGPAPSVTETTAAAPFATGDAPAPSVMEATAPPAPPSVILPITDMVHAPPPQPAGVAPRSVAPTVPEAAQPFPTAGETKEKQVGLEEEEEEEVVSLIECTVSSPVDSGVLPLRDSSSTENKDLNGELSS